MVKIGKHGRIKGTHSTLFSHFNTVTASCERRHVLFFNSASLLKLAGQGSTVI